MTLPAGRRYRDTKSRRMRFWRRRRHHSPPVLLPPLDRLGELVERVVTLLDETPAPIPAAEQPMVEPPAELKVEEEAEHGHVLFVPSPDGYRLVGAVGPPPAALNAVTLEQRRYRVARLGPSPLPGDRRRCAFLEQERPVEDRTPTGARGEPDRRHESRPPG